MPMSREGERPRIDELIVVEGRDDITAVKRAVEAEVFAVRGFAVRRPEVLSMLREAQERVGVIVLTDPDRAGEQIRSTIEAHVPEARHAYIMRADGTRATDGNIGVENATPEVIQAAVLRARQKAASLNSAASPRFTIQDLLYAGLTACPEANERRQRLGQLLGVGYASAKQLLRRLHAFQISRDEFEAAVAALDDE